MPVTVTQGTSVVAGIRDLYKIRLATSWYSSQPQSAMYLAQVPALMKQRFDLLFPDALVGVTRLGVNPSATSAVGIPGVTFAVTNADPSLAFTNIGPYQTVPYFFEGTSDALACICSSSARYNSSQHVLTVSAAVNSPVTDPLIVTPPDLSFVLSKAAQATVTSGPVFPGSPDTRYDCEIALLYVFDSVRVIAVPPCPKPAVPLNVLAAPDRYTRSTLVSWNAVTGATGYLVRRDGTIAYCGSRLQWRDAWEAASGTGGVTPKTPAHVYSVSAVNHCGEGAEAFAAGMENA